jgi:hypothetical protein
MVKQIELSTRSVWPHPREPRPRDGPGQAISALSQLTPIAIDWFPRQSSARAARRARRRLRSSDALPGFALCPWLRRLMCGRRRIFSACRYAHPERNRMDVSAAAKPVQIRTTAALSRIRTSIRITNGVGTPDAAWQRAGPIIWPIRPQRASTVQTSAGFCASALESPGCVCYVKNKIA